MSPHVNACEKVKEFLSQGWKLIDVRESWEFAQGRIQGAQNVNLRDIDTLGKDSKYMLYCRSGARSGMVEQHLIKKGIHAINIGSISTFVGCIEF
jgi:rhodanese-related sulfurtransferase